MKKDSPIVVEQTGALSYMPQLDSLRALAVGGVFLSHWANKTALSGALGVRLFFVLSGFLITSILLRARNEIETHGTPVWRQLRSFYLRRFLRLFPALVLLIAVLVLLDWESIRRTWVWHLTYLSNIYFALRGEYEGPISPLWSLSVEEQFYLIWPLVVLNLPRKYLPHAATALIGCALLWRVGVLYEGTRSLFTYVLPFNWLDGLGFGALLSITAQNTGVETHPLSSAGKVVGLPIFVLLLGATLLDRAVALSSILLEFVASLFFTFLVAQASVGFKGLIGRVLNYAALVYLGRISYGLYLYHAFVPDAFKWAMHRVGIPLTAWDVPAPLFEAVQSLSAVYASRVTALIMVVIYSSIAIGIASISWFLWERPLNALRQYVRYPGLSRVAPPASFQRAS